MSLPKNQIWELVHAARRRLADDLTPLTDGEWTTPSLCEGWSVHDVLGHLLETAHCGRIAFTWWMVRARGDFDRANEISRERYQCADPHQTLAAFRRAVTMRKTPPAPRATRLVEAIVHGEDIRRPLGIAATYPSVAAGEALEHQLRTPASFGGGRERAAGLRLLAADTGDSWGEGPEVSGQAVDLLMALSGRPLEPGRLTGPGASSLLAEHS